VTPGNVARGWLTFQLPGAASPKRAQIRIGSSIAEIDLDE
jgi:hypothetical protein